MRTLAATLIISSIALGADDVFVTGAPAESEVGRFAIVRSGDLSIKLDSRTSNAWILCPKKGQQSWCRIKDIPGAATGPSGRYRLVEGGVLHLIDTVSGRSWLRCDLPTPEKGTAWCAVAD